MVLRGNSGASKALPQPVIRRMRLFSSKSNLASLRSLRWGRAQLQLRLTPDVLLRMVPRGPRACLSVATAGRLADIAGLKGALHGMNSDIKKPRLFGLPVALRGGSAGGPADVVRRFTLFWVPGDIDGALALIAVHSVYALYISGELLPFAGETVGRDNIAGALRQMRADFEYLLYRPLDLVEKGDEVRYQVEFMYRHRRSGEVLNGRFRMVMRVEDGLIVRTDEYHDRAKVEAFLRLFCS